MSYDEHLIRMAGGDGEPDLDQIQRRSRDAMNFPGRMTIEQSQADVPALLAVVRSQQAKIERVRELAEKWQADFPSKARAVHAALTATEGA